MTDRYNDGFQGGVIVTAIALSVTAMVAHLSTAITGHGSFETATAVILVAALLYTVVFWGGKRG